MDHKLLDILRIIKENPSVRFDIDEFIDGDHYLTMFLYDEEFNKKDRWSTWCDRTELWIYIDKLDVYTFFEKNKFRINYCSSICTIDSTPFTHKELCAKTILRYYRKYRYNIYRKRRDPLKQELMAYCYHPSRMDFSL